jgi:hypothetical protein
MIATGILVASGVDAATLVFNTSDSQFTPNVDNQGWWAATSSNFDLNDNYFTGTFPAGIDEHRSFFTFDLTGLVLGSEVIVSARLELARFLYLSGAPSETLGLFDVSTDAATLNNNAGTDSGIFADLGSGTSYGTFLVPVHSFSEDLLVLALNGAAMADISAAAGDFFSIGGALLSIGGSSTQETLFGNSFGGGPSVVQRLVLETAPAPALTLASVPVPEPHPVGLLTFGLGLTGAAARLAVRRGARHVAPARGSAGD